MRINRSRCRRGGPGGVKEESKVGTRTTLDVLNAEQELLDARIDQVKSQHDRDLRCLQIKAAVGQLTADNSSCRSSLRSQAPLRGCQEPVGRIQQGRCALQSRPSPTTSAVSGIYAVRSRIPSPTQMPRRFRPYAAAALSRHRRRCQATFASVWPQHRHVMEMLRCAKDLKFKARAIESNWERLAKRRFPAIAERRDGSFFIVSKVADDTALILDPAVGRRSR
jgi:hypothetical protein